LLVCLIDCISWLIAYYSRHGRLEPCCGIDVIDRVMRGFQSAALNGRRLCA
jgi:hypothetical protein